jgi:hypothetical protein
MIAVDDVVVINPRARNRRIFNEIVESIALVGIKRPIASRSPVSTPSFVDFPCYGAETGSRRTASRTTPFPSTRGWHRHVPGLALAGKSAPG